MLFGDKDDNAYLIDPAFVKGDEWLQKHEIPVTLQKKLGIYVLLDKDVITISQELRKDEECSFGLWDVINDQCFAVIRKEIVHHETEDGYPIDVIGYHEWFEPMEKTMEITERINRCIQASEQTRKRAFQSHYIG